MHALAPSHDMSCMIREAKATHLTKKKSECTAPWPRPCVTESEKRSARVSALPLVSRAICSSTCVDNLQVAKNSGENPSQAPCRLWTGLSTVASLPIILPRRKCTSLSVLYSFRYRVKKYQGRKAVDAKQAAVQHPQGWLCPAYPWNRTTPSRAASCINTATSTRPR